MRDKTDELDTSITNEYYTPKEVSILLNLSIDTVYDMLREEQLPAIRLGTGKRQLWRIPIAEFRSFLNSIRTGPGQNEPQLE